MKTRWMIAPATALLGLTLALTACGGGDDNTASSTATATAVTTDATTTQKATATPKKTATPKATATSEESATPAGTTDYSTPDIKECDLVKPDDLGLLASDTFDAGSQAGDICTFTGLAGVIVLIGTYNLGDNAKELFEGLAVTFGDDILNDPGDEAYYDADLGLSILQGNIELDIRVTDTTGADNRASAFAVSDVALPNLP
jgi:hypothetical protein